MNNNRLYVVSGPSGAGKTKLTRKLAEAHPHLRLSVSFTTRLPRLGEVDGVHYRFISRKQFSEMVSRGKFLEWAEYPPGAGSFYGTPVSEAVRPGRILLEIETQGARQIRQLRPDAVLVFIKTSLDSLRGRIEKRGGISGEEVQRRLARAEEELVGLRLFDFVIENRDGDEGFGEALQALQAIVRN